MARDLYNSDWHDPVERPELLNDPVTGWPFHRGSLIQDPDHLKLEAQDLRHPGVAPFRRRLSRDPSRASEEIWWLRRRINPFITKDLLRAAEQGKSEYTRGFPLEYMAKYRPARRADLPILLRILRRERKMLVLAACFRVAVNLLKAKAQPLALAAMKDPRWRFKYGLLWFFNHYGTVEAVPVVAEFVRRVVRRPRDFDGRETDLTLAIEFLNRMIDRSPLVIPAFCEVVRYWHNLSYDESDRIHSVALWIRLRTLEPVEPLPTNRRVKLQTGSGVRRLWKNKERFHAWDSLSPKEQAKRRPK